MEVGYIHGLCPYMGSIVYLCPFMELVMSECPYMSTQQCLFMMSDRVCISFVDVTMTVRKYHTYTHTHGTFSTFRLLMLTGEGTLGLSGGVVAPVTRLRISGRR